MAVGILVFRVKVRVQSTVLHSNVDRDAAEESSLCRGLTVRASSGRAKCISGQVPGPGYVVQYNTARVNSYPRNVVSFTPTSVGNAGGALTIALRNSSNRTFARATSARSAVTVKADNGNIRVAGGSFYINAEISGGCGAPCGASTWSANLSYSNTYTG